MKHSTPVHRLADLEQFGIKPLTGEACTYSLRTLCDVNEDGRALLSEFYGLPELGLSNNWNSTVNDKPAIGSVMLTHRIVDDLATFAFFRLGALAICNTKQHLVGIFDQDTLTQYTKHLEDHPENGWGILRNHGLTSLAPHAGSRNVHAFTGRVQ